MLPGIFKSPPLPTVLVTVVDTASSLEVVEVYLDSSNFSTFSPELRNVALVNSSCMEVAATNPVEKAPNSSALKPGCSTFVLSAFSEGFEEEVSKVLETAAP